MGIFDRVRGALSTAGGRAARLLPGQGDPGSGARDRRARPADEGDQPHGATPFLHDEDAPGTGQDGQEAPGSEAEAEAPQRRAGHRTHTLQPGETLDDVAQRYAVTQEQIVELNGIDDAELVFAGQVFRLP